MQEEMGSGKRDYAAVTLTETWQKMEVRNRTLYLLTIDLIDINNTNS